MIIQTDVIALSVTYLRLIFDACIMLISIELGTLFLSRSRKQRQERKILVGWGLIFLGLGALEVFHLWNFYFLDEIGRAILWPLLNSTGALVIIGIVAFLEYFYQKYKSTKYLVTIIGILSFTVGLLVPGAIGTFIINVYFLFLFGFTLAFFRKLASLASGSVRRNVILFVFAFYALMFGNVLSNVELAGPSLDPSFVSLLFLARLIKIVAILLMWYVLFELPIFLEVDWKEKLVSISIIHQNTGIMIHNTTFQQLVKKEINGMEVPDELKATGLVGVTTLLKEISQSTERLKIIDHGDLKILLEYGQRFIIALTIREEKMIYHEKLKMLRETIDVLFNDILTNWNGDVEYFQPLGAIVKKTF